MPTGIAGASLRAPAHVGLSNVLREQNPQVSAITDGGWERITLIVDSCASDTVIPPKVCRAAAIRHSSKVGTEYEVEVGRVAKNIGQKQCGMNMNEEFQIGSRNSIPIVDKVNKALLSVNRVCAPGHDIVICLERKETLDC